MTDTQEAMRESFKSWCIGKGDDDGQGLHPDYKRDAFDGFVGGWCRATAQSAEKIARLEISYALYSAEENLIWELMPELRNTDSQYELHEAVHEKIARLEAERNWQPIETAPKDGTEIIIHAVRAGGTFIAKWDVDFRGWIVSKGTWVSGPSHWMPLPPAPVKE